MDTHSLNLIAVISEDIMNAYDLMGTVLKNNPDNARVEEAFKMLDELDTFFNGDDEKAPKIGRE